MRRCQQSGHRVGSRMIGRVFQSGAARWLAVAKAQRTRHQLERATGKEGFV